MCRDNEQKQAWQAQYHGQQPLPARAPPADWGENYHGRRSQGADQQEFTKLNAHKPLSPDTVKDMPRRDGLPDEEQRDQRTSREQPPEAAMVLSIHSRPSNG